MEGSTWGGSEELWFRVADFSLDNNQSVTVCVKHWKERNDKIDHLEKRGAKIIQRTSDFNPSILLRIIRKITFYFFGNQTKTEHWSWIEKEKPKHIIISLGGPHDFLNHPGLMEVLDTNKISYSIIQQFNFEHIVYNSSNRNLVDQFYSKAKFAYFVSNRNLEVTERSICKKLNNSIVISNPANLSKLEVVPFPQNWDQINFACVARLDCMFKAQDVLISVFSNEKWLKRNWKLNFYGEGMDLEYLEKLVEYHNLNSKITFHGHVKVVDEIWMDNHILILPSLAEGTPLSLIEAMVCGRPAIVSDVGGNSELIEDGINGYIIPAVNVQQCALIIEKAWQNRDKWHALGIESRNQVLRRINFDSYKDIYRNAIG